MISVVEIIAPFFHPSQADLPIQFPLFLSQLWLPACATQDNQREGETGENFDVEF